MSGVPADHPARARDRLIDRLRAAGCVFAEDEADLLVDAARDAVELESMAQQRIGGLPLEQVVGWAAFHGLRIEVDPGVFVPRRRTELLVDEALACLPRREPQDPAPVVVDLCCGSGAVGAAVLDARGDVELHAADVDPAAVRGAARNLASTGGVVHRGDLFDALPARLRGRVRLVVANVPYVPSAEIELLPREARLHEPRAAVDGGGDGLDVLRRVADGVTTWLVPGGQLLVETSDHQSSAATASFEQAGMTVRLVTSEDLGATVLIGTRPC
ncbi:MAG TPA: putative protein N(5)-glutamine methyltransferase [Acidimicrobiales bacterium]